MEMAAGASTLAISQIILFLTLNGGLSFPLGVPPEAEDRLMALVAPEQPIYYTTWSGVAKPNADSTNQTEQLLAEEEIQHAISKIETTIKQALDKADGIDDQQRVIIDMAMRWGKTMLTRPAVIYVSDFRMGAGVPQIKGAALFRVDGLAGEIKASLEKLQAQFAGENIKNIEIDGGQYHQIAVHEMIPPITWGIRGRYLVIGVGKDSVVEVFANVKRNSKELPGWLTGVRSQAKVQRFSSVSYLDLQKVKDAALKLAGPEAEKIVDAFGAGNIKSYSAVTGLDETGFVNQSQLGIEGESTGIVRLLEQGTLTRDAFKRVPHDAPVAASVKLDAAKLFDAYFEIAAHFDPDAVADMRREIGAVEEQIGIRIRDDLMGSLGDTWTVYASPSDGGIFTGWTASVAVNNRMKLEEVNNTLSRVAAAAFDDAPFAPKIKQKKLGEHEINYVVVPDRFPLTPTWCITENELVFGLFPQSVKSHVLRASGEKSLADQPQVAKALAGQRGPMMLTYIDSRTLIEMFYSFIQYAAQIGLNELRGEGVAIELGLLPSTGAIIRHLRPSVSVVRRTQAGLEAVSHQTLPTGNIGSSGPIAVAALLPAVQAARQAAKRTQSQNNLRHMALAFYNYHDSWESLPAAYNTDADGKPLLSWRVHILPYIEEEPLYLQFHLDEPWDSEHNKKLIERMPQTFRSPNSKSPPNTTTYLAIGGENGCFRPPAATAKSIGKIGKIAGTRFADIVDGTSNTIFVVEAGEDAAVPWTKPEEFKPNGMDPLKGLLGMYPKGINVMMGDASVRFLPETMDKVNIQKLFDRRDGQVVELR